MKKPIHNTDSVEVPAEWHNECVMAFNDAFRDVAAKLHKKWGNRVPFPAFVHCSLTYAMTNCCNCAPLDDAAFEMIQQAFDLVKQMRQDRAK